MKIQKLALAAVILLTLGARTAQAQQDAGTQLNDANDTSTYASSTESRSDENSSDNASAVFDGQPSGSVQDPTTLEPRGTVVEPNSDE